MELSEKIVRESFAKKNLKPLVAHLRAITLDEETVGELANLLKRGCLPLFEYPNGKGEAQRDASVAEIAATVEARTGVQQADRVREVIELLKLIESGYRTILGALADIAVAQYSPERRVSALLDLSAERREAIRAASAEAIVIDGLIDPIGLGIADGHGNSVSPDVPIDVDVVTMTMALKMEGYQRGWFDGDDQFVLPERVSTTPEERAKAHDLLVCAQVWRHWTWIEEETRYFDGSLRDVPPEELPPEYHKTGVTRLLHHLPGDLGWHALDLAYNERMLLRMKQESAKMLMSSKVSDLAAGIAGKVELFPKAFVSVEELTSAEALDHALSAAVSTDKSLFRGLRFAEWIRGYAVLQKLVSEPYDASGNDPAALVVEVSRAELVQTLQRLGLGGGKAEIFIKLATFGKSSRDLFDTPLIRIGANTMLIYGPALLGAIPAQTTLSRLGSLKQSLEARGKAFERAMLDFMKAQGLEAVATKAKRGGEEYEYDLLVRWDGRIFLFECKSRSLSSNNLVASYYDMLAIPGDARQVRRLADALVAYPDILEGLFGPGAAELEIVPCLLSALPMSLLEPIDGVYFTDSSSVTRLFNSPTFNLIAGRKKGVGGGPELHGTGTHRLWAGRMICSDDLMRQLREPIQLELMLRQIGPTLSQGWLGEGTLAITTRMFHQPVSTAQFAGLLRDRAAQKSAEASGVA